MRHYSGETVANGYSQFNAGLEQQYPQHELGPLRAATLADLPAFQFSVQFLNWRREGFFLALDDGLYRIIFDPESEINREILETVKVK